MILNISKTLPSGVHVASATRPPGLQTRAISAAASSGRCTVMIPKLDHDRVEGRVPVGPAVIGAIAIILEQTVDGNAPRPCPARIAPATNPRM